MGALEYAPCATCCDDVPNGITPPRPRSRAKVAEQLRRIQSVTEASLAHLEIDELLDTLLERVREILEVDTAAILLIDRTSREMVATAAKGIEEEVRSGVRIPIGQGSRDESRPNGEP